MLPEDNDICICVRVYNYEYTYVLLLPIYVCTSVVVGVISSVGKIAETNECDYNDNNGDDVRRYHIAGFPAPTSATRTVLVGALYNHQPTVYSTVGILSSTSTQQLTNPPIVFIELLFACFLSTIKCV